MKNSQDFAALSKKQRAFAGVMFLSGFLASAALVFSFGRIFFLSVSNQRDGRLFEPWDYLFYGLILLFLAAFFVFYYLYAKKTNEISRLLKDPESYKRIMASAENLEKAIRLGFDYLPLGSSLIGPQGKLSLKRNILPKGDPQTAEICVMDEVKKDGRIIFTASWGQNDKEYRIRANFKDEMIDWSDKW